MIPFLEAEHASKPATPPARIAMVQFYLKDSSDFRETRVELSTGKFVEETKLTGKHSYLDPPLMDTCEVVCHKHPEVQKAIKALELPEGAEVCIEPWTYGTDGMNDMSKRILVVCPPPPKKK